MSTANPFQSPMEPSSAASRDSSFSILWLLTAFNGRIPRRVFWGATISLSLISYIAASLIVFATTSTETGEPSAMSAALLLPLYVVLIWFSLAVTVKRWHDRGKSGWWIFIGLIPIVGPIWAFIETGCLRGTEGPNSYGSDPT